MRWVFVGAGNMASSLIGGLITSGGHSSGNKNGDSGNNSGQICVVDPSEEACRQAQNRFGIVSGTSLADVLLTDGRLDDGVRSDALGIVFAVKPHIVEPACRAFTELYGSLDAASRDSLSTLFISVAAGVRASSMEQWLPAQAALVRCMPNTPALLGLGATALFANNHCTSEHRQQAQVLLDTAGMTQWVEEESLLDAVTALSGSGPAYFFYLIELMSEAACKLGLDETTAREMAIETAYGAASMARAREHSPAVLRENVTSKGGTTAAALQTFKDQGLPATVMSAMQAAHDRAVELGDQLTPD